MPDLIEDDGESLDVRVDRDEARTVIGGAEAPAFRVVARGGYIMALLDDLRGVRVRNLWLVPGAAKPVVAAAPLRPVPAQPAAAQAPAPQAAAGA